jgi:hypothetical protein
VFRRDYIVRLIEEMTQSIGTVLFQLRQEKKHGDAFDLLEGYFSRLYLPKSKVLVGLSDSDLLSLFRTNDIIETDKMAAASIVLHQEADVCREWGRLPDAYARDVTALLLRCEAALHDERGTASDHAEEVETLLHSLDPYELPLRLLTRLAAYYEAAGRFDQAENMWYRLWIAPAPEAAAAQSHELGAAFYERLLALADDELIAGGLPREEVEEGLAALAKRRASAHAESAADGRGSKTQSPP